MVLLIYETCFLNLASTLFHHERTLWFIFPCLVSILNPGISAMSGFSSGTHSSSTSWTWRNASALAVAGQKQSKPRNMTGDPSSTLTRLFGWSFVGSVVVTLKQMVVVKHLLRLIPYSCQTMSQQRLQELFLLLLPCGDLECTEWWCMHSEDITLDWTK